jgi:hypothetical protein
MLDLWGVLVESFGREPEAMIDDDSDVRVAVTYYDDRPIEGLRSYCTLGLSVHELERDGRSYRQEMMFVTHDDVDLKRTVAFLGTFVEDIVHRRRALVRGDVVTPGHLPRLGMLMTSIFVCRPVVARELWPKDHRGCGPADRFLVAGPDPR